jgi:hypothetical protein
MIERIPSIETARLAVITIRVEPIFNLGASTVGLAAPGGKTADNHEEVTMTSFDEREKSFERRFAQEEELKFRATARRNHLAGLWAAKKLGLSESDSQSYASSIVTADLDTPQSDVVFEKVRSDLSSHGIAETDDEIRRMLDQFMRQALTDLRNG